MSTRVVGLSSVIAMVSSLFGTVAQAVDVGHEPIYTIASDPSRLEQLEGELAALRARMESYEAVDVGSGYGESRESSATPGLCAGYEFLFVQPHYDDQAAFYIDRISPNTVRAAPFSTRYELTPRIWLSCTAPNGLGVRARFWQYDHNTTPRSYSPVAGFRAFGRVEATPFNSYAIAVPGQTLTATHSMTLDTFDFDVTQDFNWHQSTIIVFGGIRYARMAQSYLAEVRDGGGAFQDSTFLDHSFEGVGPTVGLDLKRQIGASRLSVVTGGRASVLFGNYWEDAGENYHNWGEVEVIEESQVKAIGEARIALEYEREVLATSILLVRCGYEGHIWFQGGGPNADGGDLGLEGLTIAIGLIR